MKRLFSIAAIVVLSLSALVLVQCDTITGDAPTNVKLEAATSTTIKVTWSAPSTSTPDRYIVSFMETGTSSYVKLTPEPTTTTFDHNPAGKTGTYKVTAVFGSTEYDAATTPTSAPIATASTERGRTQRGRQLRLRLGPDVGRRHDLLDGRGQQRGDG